MILRKKEAIILSSFIKFLNLSIEERKAKIEDALVEISIEINAVTPAVSNYYARRYIENEFSYFTNSYLQTFLSHQLGRDIEVKGKGRRLFSCLCCGYKTLDKRGEYDICKVCYWEDDGSGEINRYSGVNHMTLFQAKENFKKFGAKLEERLIYVDPDRMLQYERSV